VTVLTSLDAGSLGAAWGRKVADVGAEVVRLAGIAAEGGAHGVVCSGAEAGAVKAAFGDELAILVPGIRRAGGDSHDQARVVTPAAAVAAGASYLVLGRAVTEAVDPAAELRGILSEIG
jgi:orotidine-5'-phosphate decarboxylase